MVMSKQKRNFGPAPALQRYLHRALLRPYLVQGNRGGDVVHLRNRRVRDCPFSCLVPSIFANTDVHYRSHVRVYSVSEDRRW